MRKYINIFLLVLVCLFFFVGCGETQDQPKEEKKAEIELLLDAEYTVGEEVDILDYVNVFYATKDDIVWSVSDESVAKVENGKLVSSKAGTVTVTAKVGEVEVNASITFKATLVKISFELNEGECTAELPTERDGSVAITLPTPVKEGATFAGWYASADFSGEKVTELNSSNLSITKLYAKWTEKTYKVVYHLDTNGTETKEEVEVKYTDIYNVVAKEDSSSAFFSGWFKENTYVTEVKTIGAKSYEEATLDLYGKMVDKTNSYSVDLDFNGGSCTYQTREEVIADFLADYNYIIKKTYTNVKQIGTSASTPLTFHTFYKGTTADGTKASVKWKWLAQYLYDLSASKLSSDNYNVTGLKSLLTDNFDDTENNKKGVSTAFRAFLNGMEIGANTGITVDFSNYDYANGFWFYLSDAESYKTKLSAYNAALPSLYKENYTFKGWYRDLECTQGPVKNITADGKLYAYYEENIPVTDVKVVNKPDGVVRYESLQLEWTISPADAIVKHVQFSSSNKEVATIDENGIIKGLTIGTTTIRMQSDSQSGAYDEFELEIYSPNYFQVSYETNSYVTVGETIKLNALLKTRKGDVSKMTWISLDKSIATVDNKGVVTGVKSGFVKIRAMASGSADMFDFGVTVLDKNASDVVKFIASCNEPTVFTRYNLNVGYTYFYDVYGSVSRLLYNKEYVIDRSLEATALADVDQSGVKPSIEFICVHYTGNMGKGAGAKSNAKYLNTNNNGVSIHYCTGNDGIYHCLPDNIVAWHAGDGHSQTGFQWKATGVKVEASDPEYPVWGISSNGKFTINGRETNQNVPEGSTEETKNLKSSTFMYKGVEQNAFNDMGLAFDIRNGEYYMGTTWWCYSQVKAGRICNKGGNSNSIGIESAVDAGTDLWLTWQMTAQLVAHLMQENNLNIYRVWGHHFWTAKDCPQPMLQNQLECWWEFIELVKAEYELLTKYSNYEITFTQETGSKNVNNYGRVTKQVQNDADLLTYTVSIKNKTTGTIETIELASILNSAYDR